MAGGYTANYGLCQWQPTDKFLREEFNGDNAKIDAALKAAEERAEEKAQAAETKADRALSGLEAADYNIYNLLLQSEYEGKYTGYKKALLYDGFLDESRVASKSTAVQIKDRAARLSKSGQGDITTARTSGFCFLGDDPCSTGTKTATGGGVLTGITFSFYPSDNYGCSTQLTVTYNGEAVASQTVTFAVGGERQQDRHPGDARSAHQRGHLFHQAGLQQQFPVGQHLSQLQRLHGRDHSDHVPGGCQRYADRQGGGAGGNGGQSPGLCPLHRRRRDPCPERSRAGQNRPSEER